MALSPINYQARIQKLVSELSGASALIPSQPVAIRNSDVHHAYRQDSFFHYLTGLEEDHCALVVNSSAPKGQQVSLFVTQKIPELELWDGIRLGVDQAKKTMPVDQAFPIEELGARLATLVNHSKGLYYRLGWDESLDRTVIQSLAGQLKLNKRKQNGYLPLFDANILAGKLRLQKAPEEVERMRKAAAITATAFSNMYKSVRAGMNERDVHASILSDFMRSGSEMEAYGSIVAGGANACVLHYRANNKPLNDGELLLVDAGSQFEYYASDVTRTFPIGKTFTSEQKAIYELVLDSQLKCIALCKPGVTLPKLHESVIDTLTQGLVDLKLLKGSKAENIEKGLFKKYFPHGTSHWIGMDVHDVGDYSLPDMSPLPLPVGSYFSVEPGIYINADDSSVPAGFRGVGIRIEDDVLITASGHDVVTAAIAKNVRELENRN